MFDPGSRYYNLETAVLKLADGREVAYKRRRFLPRSEDLQTLAEVTVVEGERIDQIAARTISDPEQFWRIADANDGMDPTDLTAEPGRKLRVAVPRPEGLPR